MALPLLAPDLGAGFATPIARRVVRRRRRGGRGRGRGRAARVRQLRGGYRGGDGSVLRHALSGGEVPAGDAMGQILAAEEAEGAPAGPLAGPWGRPVEWDTARSDYSVAHILRTGGGRGAHRLRHAAARGRTSQLGARAEGGSGATQDPLPAAGGAHCPSRRPWRTRTARGRPSRAIVSCSKRTGRVRARITGTPARQRNRRRTGPEVRSRQGSWSCQWRATGARRPRGGDSMTKLLPRDNPQMQKWKRPHSRGSSPARHP